MRDNLIQDILKHLDIDQSLSVGKCPKEVEEYLETLNIPLNVKRLLQWRWINNSRKIGPYNFYSVSEILSDEETKKFMSYKMIPIGYAIYGDPLVLFFPDEDRCEVGFISHNKYYEEECDPRDAYTIVTNTVERLLHCLVEERFLPIDYYSARELNELKQDDNN